MEKRKLIANPLNPVATGGLTYLDRSSFPPEELEAGRITLLSLSINDECNLQCPHCIERSYNRGKDKYNLLKLRLEELPDKSILWTSIAGKEPTTTPQRLEEIASIAKIKSDKVILMSNGILLNEELQKRLNGNMDYLDISIDGIDSYKHAGESWGNVLTASKNGFEKVSVLSILGRDNYRKVGALVDKMAEESDGRVAHSIGFYLGCPGDPALLEEDEIIQGIESILKREKSITIQIGLTYSRFLPRIFREFGIDINSKRYDSKTGIPSFEIGKNSLLIPASHLETPLNFLRAEIDGNVYFGCSHLMLNGNTSHLRVGNLEKESLMDINEDLMTNPLVEKSSYVDAFCLNSGCYRFCMGGDRLNGVVFTGESKDPHCSKLN
jgi:sulfatase maturation enzyme AslB (radical SAM superfamily)